MEPLTRWGEGTVEVVRWTIVSEKRYQEIRLTGQRQNLIKRQAKRQPSLAPMTARRKNRCVLP